MNDNFTIEEFGGWWYLVDIQDGVVSRWASFDLAKLEYRILTGREWGIESQ